MSDDKARRYTFWFRHVPDGEWECLGDYEIDDVSWDDDDDDMWDEIREILEASDGTERA